MGARCQICDGPVVNGRCKLCGMPYRKDEVLYHLNESRSDHYRHATDAARKEMRMNQVPVQDRKKAAQTTVKRMDRPAAGSAYRKASTAGKKKEEKKKSWVSWIVPIVILAGMVLPQGIDYIKTQYETNIATRMRRQEYEPVEVSESAAELWVDTEDLVLRAIMDWENSTIEAGSSVNGYCIEPGKYVLQNTGGESIVRELNWETGEETVHILKLDGAQVILELTEKDMIWLDSMDNKENFLLLYLIQQYDE